MEHPLKQISHHMSALLRHRAGEVGLRMDAAGWVDLEELVEHLGVPRHLVEEAAQHNNKARFEVSGERIRASQGHSLEGMPVTREALEASWTVFASDDPLWHGTRTEVAESIAREGILRGERSHVHLAASRESHVGKRANVGVLLEISPARLRAAGQTIYESPNGVILCRHVPPGCIVDIHPMSRSARKNASALRAALGLPA